MLRDRLDALVATYDIAAFAYGRADIVVANVGRVLDRMQLSPFEYLSNFDRRRATDDFAGFSHRFHKTPELVDLFSRIADAIANYGSLSELFRRCYDERDQDIGPS